MPRHCRSSIPLPKSAVAPATNIFPLRLRPLALWLPLALGNSGPALAADAPAVISINAGTGTPVGTSAAEAALPEVTITGAAINESTEKTGAYTTRRSSSATRLDLSLRETPQSVSVITRARMDDFKQDNVNEVLANSTGVTVEKIETDRTYYTARGFDITNFQYDGVGIPFVLGNVYGDLDTAVYDRVDVVRGANGLMSATGNPSATVNFVRKRPTYQWQASAGLTLGSWNTRRVDADVSAPLNSSGTVAGRIVVVRQEGDSYLDRYSPDKAVVYGIVEAYLSDHTLLSVGHTYQKNTARGGMWGALPLYYTDGSPTNYPVSASTSADWSNWTTQTDRSFVELSHQFGNGWQTKSILSYNTDKSDSRLFYVYGTPDRVTGAGLFSYPSLYGSDNKQTLFDMFATGQFSLAGRQHDLSFGVSWSKSTLDDISHYGRGIGTPLTSQTDFTGKYPEPAFDASIDGSKYEDRRKTAYVAARFNLADALKLITGVNATRAESNGTAYGLSQQKSASKTTPYVGAVADINKSLSAYASYTEIFNPQSETDSKGRTLDPVIGKTYELGAKSELFERKLNLSGAIFKTRQDNAAEQAGYLGTKAYYRGINAESKGVELELAGELSKGWQASAGYTRMTISSSDGGPAKTYLPRKLLRLSTTYRLPFFAPVKIGANLNWQGDIYRDQGAGIITRQDSYALLGLMARYDISKDISLALNLNNVTNKKYLASLYWAQGYYGAPRNGSASLSWKY
ncbi:MAG: TonB-dependent siderophore receptor [Pseudomonadota bacterium]